MTTYVKYSTQPNLLHLYEHVVSIHVHDLLRSEGYYVYLDYALSALTYDAGYSTFTLEIYNPNLATVFNAEMLFDFTIDEKTIMASYRQLINEEGTTFALHSDDLSSVLNGIHASPWSERADAKLNIPHNEVIDTILVREYRGLDLSTYSLSMNFNSLAMDAKSRSSLLLLLGHNIQVFISNLTGYYREDLRIAGDNVELSFRVASPLNESIDYQNDIKLAKEILLKMSSSIPFDLLIETSIDDKKYNEIINSISYSRKNERIKHGT